MSSISAQGVVERASAELTKRINGLRGNKHHSTKTSVMERVTNVFCGSSNTAVAAPEKPSRLLSSRNSKITSSPVIVVSKKPKLPQVYITSWEQLIMDERFLSKLFFYFSAGERCILAQVCMRWRDILYRSPRYWTGLVPVLQCREMRISQGNERTRLYSSLIRRGFHSLCLMGASDEDALDLVSSFPLASKHVHSLSLRCSSITDRGLETLLDHLQALYELELAGCNEITEAGLWACLNQRIVSLTLTDCINIADEAVGAVAQLLPALYEFSLQAYHVTDAALGYFSPKQSNTLNVLRLHSCWELTNHGIVNIGVARDDVIGAAAKIAFVRICSYIGGNCILVDATNIRTNAISAAAIRHHKPPLNHILILLEVHSLPNLTVLSLSGCSKITDDGVELIAENLRKLRSLDLSWCPRITDAALEYIACDLDELEELTLDRCVHVTDMGVGHLVTMRSLSALYLRWCSQLRDFGLQYLCDMRNLQILSLAGCPLLTASGLSSLIHLRNLRELELTNCPGASKELFDYLREQLPRCLVIE